MDNNEQPNYVLKFNSVASKKLEDEMSKFKKPVVFIIIAIIFGSIIFGENLFVELSWTARIILIGLAIAVLFSGKSEDVEVPSELQFYNDYFILYRPQFYYGNVSRREYLKMEYKNVSECVYEKSTYSKLIKIYGDGRSIWYNFKKDGTLPTQPTRDNTYTGGLIFFNTYINPDIDFVKEIEEHSPIKVIVNNEKKI